MIERFHLLEYLTFKKIELNFKKGLILFTGPSGAGKSVLINSILSTLGQKESNAKLSEVIFNRAIDLEEFGIENEDEFTIFKQIRKDKIRYFINSQAVSKKIMGQIGKIFINHLNPREIVEFDSSNLINILDGIAEKREPLFLEYLGEYKKEYENYSSLNRHISKLKIQINEIEAREDFIKFEIEKLDKIAPKIGEEDELQLLKKRISRRERVEDHLDDLDEIVTKRRIVNDVFNLMSLPHEAETFDEFFIELESAVELIRDTLAELNGIDGEYVLTRIETLAELRERHGSISGALGYRDERIHELSHLNNLRNEVQITFEQQQISRNKLIEKGSELRAIRKFLINDFNIILNNYLHLLNLGDSSLRLENQEISSNGIDLAKLYISNTDVDSLSYGEQNRVRLALLTIKTKFRSGEIGTLFLDEIDSNLSGEESMRVAKVLKELSKNYQIFAISHQPQLTSHADQHFKVFKKSEESFVTELTTVEERVEEIARMVGGGMKDFEATQFARNLISKANQH